MSNKPLTMWFTQDGHLMTRFRDWRVKQVGGKSEEAKDFDDVLTYIVARDGGQSTAGRVYFVSDSTKREYSMFLDDFDEAVRANQFNNNKIQGTFHFVKRGQSQAIKLVLKQPVPKAPWPNI